MKAIRVSRFGDPSVLELHDVPDPSPVPGLQSLVRIHAAGVNPVEAYVRSGKYARLPALPYTPGSDGAGVIEQSDLPGFPVGARVYITASVTGAYAEKALCTADQLHPLPAHVSFEQGAALGIPYGTATWALFNRGLARPGEILLVHGASGGVGIAALQLARAAGLRVFGTAGTPEGLELVLRNGAEAAFNHRDPGYLDQIKAAAASGRDGGGIDIILEMLANQNLGNDLTLLGPRGRVVVVGSRGPVEIDPRNLMGREADIRGITLFGATPRERAAIYERITAGLEDRSLNPIIGKAFPLDDAARAHEQIMASGAHGKIVLSM
jgi:NADPH2:quinone reductase